MSNNEVGLTEAVRKLLKRRIFVREDETNPFSALKPLDPVDIYMAKRHAHGIMRELKYEKIGSDSAKKRKYGKRRVKVDWQK